MKTLITLLLLIPALLVQTASASDNSAVSEKLLQEGAVWADYYLGMTMNDYIIQTKNLASAGKIVKIDAFTNSYELKAAQTTLTALAIAHFRNNRLSKLEIATKPTTNVSLLASAMMPLRDTLSKYSWQVVNGESWQRNGQKATLIVKANRFTLTFESDKYKALYSDARFNGDDYNGKSLEEVLNIHRNSYERYPLTAGEFTLGMSNEEFERTVFNLRAKNIISGTGPDLTYNGSLFGLPTDNYSLTAEFTNGYLHELTFVRKTLTTVPNATSIETTLAQLEKLYGKSFFEIKNGYETNSWVKGIAVLTYNRKNNIPGFKVYWSY